MEFMRIVNVIEILHNLMEHHQELVGTILGPHCCFLYVFIRDVDLIVLRFKINLAKLFYPIELIQQIVNAK
jgi:hypothetical protein